MSVAYESKVAVPSGGGLPGATASEWTKLWSVRSTWWCLVAAAGLMAASVVINGISLASQQEQGVERAMSMPATQMPVEAVVYLVQFALMALAALVVGSEYATGSIRSTLQWVPLRGRMLAAKSLVLTPVLFGVGVLLGVLGIGLAEATMRGYGEPYTTGDAVVTCLLIGLYLALLGILTTGVGTAVRSVAGTLTILFLVLMVVPIVLQAFGLEFLRTLSHCFPGIAGIDLMQRDHGAPVGGVTGAGLVLVVWAAAAQAAALAVLRGRDA